MDHGLGAGRVGAPRLPAHLGGEHALLAVLRHERLERVAVLALGPLALLLLALLVLALALLQLPAAGRPPSGGEQPPQTG